MPSESGVHDVQHNKLRHGADMGSLLLLSTIGYVCSLQLPLLLAAAISCIDLILLGRLRNRLKSPSLWWGGIGLCTGS